jgi:hypothetical protein
MGVKCEVYDLMLSIDDEVEFYSLHKRLYLSTSSGARSALLMGVSLEAIVEFYSSIGLICPFCITILYHNLLLFIDIFHI